MHYPTSPNVVGNLAKLVNVFLVLSLVLFVVSGWAWWHYVRSNPENTFYGMLDNNLKTRGVSREVTQSSNGQSLSQTAQLSLTPQRVAQGITDIGQEGTVSASIQTENISTPTADYVRYVNIDTNQKGAQGQSLDFSGLLNVWGKTTFEDPTRGSGELLTESLMGVVPVGNLDVKARADLMELIKEQQVYDFKNDIKREVQNGRPVYVYSVTEIRARSVCNDASKLLRPTWASSNSKAWIRQTTKTANHFCSISR